MNRKLLTTSIIAIVAAGVAYSQLEWLSGGSADDGDGVQAAGTIGLRDQGNNITLDNGIRNHETITPGEGPAVEQPRTGITLDNGIKREAVIEPDE